MQKIFVFLLPIFIVFFPLKIYSNTAMPGFYDIGGSGAFVPFFEKDSIYLDKIQMQSEKITIFLSQGFAVVKGEYYMKNLTHEDIILNTGYPINSQYMSDNYHMTPYSMQLQDLYELRVWVNDESIKTQKLADKEDIAYKIKNVRDLENWYIWESIFKAQSITKITVYFIVNTNEATLLEGYAEDKEHNGFTYILESGRAWAKNIEKGRVYIRLGADIEVSDIIGISPLKKFMSNNQKDLIYDFENLEPNAMNNIIIRYDNQNKDFDFDEIIQDAEKYYQKLDKLSQTEISTEGFIILKANNFEVKETFMDRFIRSISLNPIVFLLMTIIVIAFIIFIFMFIRKIRRKR